MTNKSSQAPSRIRQAANDLGYSPYNTEADRRTLEKEMHDALDAAGQGPEPGAVLNATEQGMNNALNAAGLGPETEKPLTRKKPETMSRIRKAAAIAAASAIAIGVGNEIKEKLPYDRVFNPPEPVDPLPRDAQSTDFPKDPRQAQITVTQPEKTVSKISE